MRPSSERGTGDQRRRSLMAAGVPHLRRQQVATAAHGLDQPRRLAGVAQALAQAADRHVDDALQRQHLAATGGVGDGVAVEDLLRMVEGTA